MRKSIKNVDWRNLGLMAWHLALLGGSAYLSVTNPALATALQPYIQAAGQFSPTPAPNVMQPKAE